MSLKILVFVIFFGASFAIQAQETALPTPNTEELENLSRRVDEFKVAAEEQLANVAIIKASLAEPGDCGSGKTVEDCLRNEIESKRGLSDIETENLELQVNAPSTLNQNAQVMEMASKAIGEMIENQDFSYKNHFKFIWDVFKGSWKNLLTKDPLITMTLTTTVWAAARAGDQKVTAYYMNPAHAWPKAVNVTSNQISYVYSVVVPLWTIGAIAKSNKILDTADELVAGVAMNEIITQGLKYSVREERPDHSDNYGFPSGHTSTTAVMATIIDQKFGHKWGIPAYAVMAVVAGSRLAQNKHKLSQDIFGAGLGIAEGLAVSRTYTDTKIAIAKKILNGQIRVRGHDVRYSMAPILSPYEKSAGMNFSWK